MPRRIAEKCRLCAKLSTEQAKLTHGPTGDNCWVGQLCHQRRSHYRNQARTNPERKRKRLALDALAQLSSITVSPSVEGHSAELTKHDLPDPIAVTVSQRPTLPPPAGSPTAEPLTTLYLPPPGTAAAYVHFYRERKDAPLHALAAELWKGGKKVAVLHPVHTLGATEGDIRRVLIRVLEQFSTIAGKPINQFRGAVELHPHQCPLRPCPLHPLPGLLDDDANIRQINL
jgi:hypothetical protein